MVVEVKNVSIPYRQCLGFEHWVVYNIEPVTFQFLIGNVLAVTSSPMVGWKTVTGFNSL